MVVQSKSVMRPNISTLTDILVERASLRGTLGTLDSSGVERQVSYRDLFEQSYYLLHIFQEAGVKPGDEIVIQLDQPEAFVRVFWACILGNMIAVPVNAVSRPLHAQKLANIWRQLRAPRLVTGDSHLAKLSKFGDRLHLPDEAAQELVAQMTANAIVYRDSLWSQDAYQGEMHAASPTDTAFVQFSSGSTSQPKGVVLSHHNLLANLDALTNHVEVQTGKDIFVSWMPLTHDMGIIGHHLLAVFNDCDQFLIETALFARRPAVWLRKLAETKATLTGSPNFGYRHVLDFCDTKHLKDLDLSSVRSIVNGAEPISSQLCDDFCKKMANLGLASNTILPAYGMAEATLMVTGAPPRSEVETAIVSRQHLRVGDRIAPPTSADDAVSLVLLGTAVKHMEVRLVDEGGNSLDDTFVGHIQIRGDSVTSGYYRNPVATARALDAQGWLNTGDIGFFHNRRLAIVGRAKDVISANGQNFYANDIETIAADELGLPLRSIVICGTPNPVTGGDDVVAFIRHRRDVATFLPMYHEIKRAVPNQCGCPINHVIPVDAIPVTTSGKKQRYKLREAYLAGDFRTIVGEIDKALASERASHIDTEWRSDLEARVAEMCQQSLPHVPLGRSDDLFAAGLDSLGATRLVAALVATFEVELPPDLIQTHSNIASLAHRIARARALHDPTPVLAHGNARLRGRFGDRIRLLRYLNERRSVLVVYCDDAASVDVVDVLVGDEHQPVYPDYVRPWSSRPATSARDDSGDGNHNGSGVGDGGDGGNDTYERTEAWLAQHLDLGQCDRAQFEREIAPQIAATDVRWLQNFADTPVVEVAPVGPLQRRHLRRGLTHPQVFRIEMSHRTDEDRLCAAIRQCFAAQELLRATIGESENGYQFRIHRPADDMFIPVIDISQLCANGQETAIECAMAAVTAKMASSPSIDHLLNRLLVLKRTQTSFTLLLLINHVVSDHESGRIFEHALNENLLGYNSNGPHLSYSHFLQHVAEPGTKLVEQFLNTPLCRDVHAAVEEFASRQREAKSSASEGPAKPAGSNAPKRPVSICWEHSFLNRDSDEHAADHDRPANDALFVYLTIARALFEDMPLPVKIALNRRVFGEFHYRNTIGEFHDNIVLTFTRSDDSLLHCHRKVADTLAFMDEHRFLLASMKDDARLRTVAGSTPFSFNHLGHVSVDEDKRLAHSLRPFPLTFFPSLSYSVGDQTIRLWLNNGLDPEQMAIVRQALAQLGRDFVITS